MAMTSGGNGGTMSEINVTPMVDVMLVLLIIFMVTAPMMQQGVQVELPKTNAKSMDANPELTVLTLTRSKQIYLGKVEIPYVELSEKLSHNMKLRNDKEVYLHADRALPYGFVIDIMAIMRAAGVENLGMVTEPVQGAPR